MDSTTKQTLLAEIMALSAPVAEVGPDEFSVSDFLTELRRQDPAVTRSMAERRLSSLLDRNILTRREATAGGHPCWAYRKV